MSAVPITYAALVFSSKCRLLSILALYHCVAVCTFFQSPGLRSESTTLDSSHLYASTFPSSALKTKVIHVLNVNTKTQISNKQQHTRTRSKIVQSLNKQETQPYD